jgi:hypothetical protein
MCAGSMSPVERAVAWKGKRVFFLTPQVLTNDLTSGLCPATSIKCVVVDEAHKALGNHSYCQVSINLLCETSGCHGDEDEDGQPFGILHNVVCSLLPSSEWRQKHLRNVGQLL